MLVAALTVGGCGDSPSEEAGDAILMPGEDTDEVDNNDAPGNNGDREFDPTDRPSDEIDVQEPIWAVSALIGPEGGTLPFIGAGELMVPAGALSEEVEITVTAYDPHIITEVTTLGYVYALEPAGLEFAVPATIALPFSGSLSVDTPADVAILWGPEGEPSTALVGHNDFEARRAYGNVHVLSRGTVIRFDASSRVCCALDGALSTTTGGWCRDLSGDARPLDFCYSVCCSTNDGRSWMHNASCLEAEGDPLEAAECQPG